MTEVDPSGLILTVISISVVFFALIILYGLYSLSGAANSGKIKIKKTVKKSKGGEDEIAAAIALALSKYQGAEDEVQVAIATALHLYLSEANHDIEPGIITIKSNPNSDWNNKQRNFRKYVRL